MRLSDTEKEKKKKELFAQMSSKQQTRILKKGYQKWDPFMEPKEPFAVKTTDIPSAKELRQLATHLYSAFIKDCKIDIPSHMYMEGAGNVASGLAYGEEKAQGMYDFSCWLKENGDKYKPILEMMYSIRNR